MTIPQDNVYRCYYSQFMRIADSIRKFACKNLSVILMDRNQSLRLMSKTESCVAATDGIDLDGTSR